jgi:hypothetical protein
VCVCKDRERKGEREEREERERGAAIITFGAWLQYNSIVMGPAEVSRITDPPILIFKKRKKK